MEGIKDLDLKNIISNSTRHVFETMLSMNLNCIEEGVRIPTDGQRVVGSVSFAGQVMGNINLHVSEAFARKITNEMLHMEIDDEESAEYIEDVIGELSNMVCGDLKSRFCDAGLHCELSIPSITIGSNFKIESMDWMRYERLGFSHKEHVAVVEVYVKSTK